MRRLVSQIARHLAQHAARWSCAGALWGMTLCPQAAQAETPSTSYIFPAGGQRGTTVPVRVGGHYLHDRAAWQFSGPGVSTSEALTRTERIWFEGPLIRQPASQQREDYPQDYAANVTIDSRTPLGVRRWRAGNAQGITASLPFVVGNLPEVVEQEIQGQAIPVAVTLPVTANGRIFPREDDDLWQFEARAGQTITCRAAARILGSPLEPQLEIRAADGKRLAEASGNWQGDAVLHFTAPADGKYVARIRDARYGGLQDYVYRLTLTAGPFVERVYPLGGRQGDEVALRLGGQNLSSESARIRLPAGMTGTIAPPLGPEYENAAALVFDVDDVAEVLEPEGAENTPRVLSPLPLIANGRIARPGERDHWKFTAAEGVPLVLELRAARLGSPLDGVVCVLDATGQVLAQEDDAPGNVADPILRFTPPQAGEYVACVRDKFASRGGPAFAYRLKIGAEKPDFDVALATESLTVNVGEETKLAVSIARRGGWQGPVRLSAAGLIGGVSCAEVVVPPNQSKSELTFKADKQAAAQWGAVTIHGHGELAGTAEQRIATYRTPDQAYASDQLWLATTLKTPFRYQGQYEFRYVPRGGTLTKTFRIERGGFEGPLEVRLADRQGRHLQGVHGPTLIVPPGQNEFTYTVSLPPWMELGRTSRTNLMLTGEVTDGAGQRHKVSFATNEQNEQLIALVSPAPLRLSLATGAIAYRANSDVRLRVQIHRDPALRGPLEMEWIVPPHVRNVRAESATIAADAAEAELKLSLGSDPGPFNAPLVLRATALHQGQPLTAETAVELTPER